MQTHPQNRSLSFLLALFALCVAVLFVSSAARAADAYEPDDSLAQATFIPSDGTTQTHTYEGIVDNINYVHRSDWLYFTPQSLGAYTVSIGSNIDRSAFSVNFYTADGVLIPMEHRLLIPYNYVVWINQPGPIYVQVEQTALATGEYEVSVAPGMSWGSYPHDEYEPDDTMRSAKEIAVDGTVQSRLSDRAYDYMFFHTKAGLLYRIDTANGTTRGFQTFSVLTSAGVEVSNSWNTGTRPQTQYYLAPQDGLMFVWANKVLAWGEPYTISIREMPLSTLSGTVVDQSGSLHEGARVTLYAWYDGPQKSVITGSDGAWSFSVLPGAYYVRVEDPSGSLFQDWIGSYFNVWGVRCPGITLDDAQVASGITGRLLAPGGVAGTVALRSGSTVQSATVTLSTPRLGGWYSDELTQTTDSLGHFSFAGLDPHNSYTLSVSAEGGYTSGSATGIPIPSGSTTQVAFALFQPVGTSLRSSSATITAGSKDYVFARATDSQSLPVTGVTSHLQVYSSGAWRSIASAVTGVSGTTTFTVVPTSNTRYRVTTDAKGDYESSTSAEKTVYVKAVIAKPTCSKSVRRGAKFSVYGDLKPRHTKGSKVATVYCYRYESGKWVYRKSFSAIAVDRYSYSRYRSTISLPYKGKWRLQASHSDSGHVSSKSSYAYVTAY